MSVPMAASTPHMRTIKVVSSLRAAKKTLVFHQYLFMESSLSSLSTLGTEESGCRRLKGGCKKIGFCLLRLSVVV